MMPLNLNALATLGLLSAVIHWLVARARITRGFWGAIWLPSWIGGLLACAACSGFWIGLGLGLAGVQPLGHGLIGVVCSGLLGVVSTPVVEGMLLWGLRATKIP
jgi:hypothetical protein